MGGEKNLNHDLLSAGWSLSRGGALLLNGSEEEYLPGPQQFPATARERHLFSFPLHTFFLYTPLSKAGGPAELGTKLGTKAPLSPVLMKTLPRFLYLEIGELAPPSVYGGYELGSTNQ